MLDWKRMKIADSSFFLQDGWLLRSTETHTYHFAQTSLKDHPGQDLKDFQSSNLGERYSKNNTLCFKLINSKTAVFNNSFFPRTVIDWNQLPDNIVQLGYLDNFKWDKSIKWDTWIISWISLSSLLSSTIMPVVAAVDYTFKVNTFTVRHKITIPPPLPWRDNSSLRMGPISTLEQQWNTVAIILVLHVTNQIWHCDISIRSMPPNRFFQYTCFLQTCHGNVGGISMTSYLVTGSECVKVISWSWWLWHYG